MKPIVFAVILLAFGCSKQTQPIANSPTQWFSKTFPRSEFKDAVGKTEGEVLAIFGKPDETAESDGITCWKYLNKAIDPITGKPHAKAGLFFKAGRCFDTIFK